MPISSIMVVDASPTDRQFLNLLDLEALLSHPDFLCIEDAE